MSPSVWQILIVVALIALLFGGRGKISSLMGDTARGIRAFKDGLKGEEDTAESSKSLPKAEREKDEVRS